MMKKRSKLSKLALSLAAVVVLTGGVATTGLIGCGGKDVPPPPITQTKPVNVTVESGAGGRATADKDNYISGDNVEIAIVPDTGFELDSVKVGDADRTHSVRDGYLTIESVTEDISVAVTFKARVSSAVSYTVKDNRGGSAALSASNGYVGDTVTLTVNPDRGYDVMTVKVNGGDNLANKLTDNSIEIQLTAATVEIEIEFYAFPIKATVTSGEGGSATITSPKETYEIGDTIEVTLAPETDWFLSSLIVNGAERKNDIVGGKLTLTVEEVGNINIAAMFDITPADINFGITATKYGEEYDLEGATVELKHESGRKYDDLYVTSTGKIVAEVIPGKYTVTVQDCVPFEITVGKDGYQSSVRAVYQPFKDAVAWDTSNIANGTVSINIDYGHLFVKDSMGDFVATYNIKKLSGGNRMSFGIKYGDKIMGFSTDLGVDNPGVWLPNNNDWNNKPWGNAGYISNDPDWYGFTDGEQTTYKSGSGIDITYVRKGSRLSLFFGERYVTSWEVFGVTEKVELAFTGWFPVGHELPVSISIVEDEITALVESTVTATATNGTATIDHADKKYALGETVTVTLAPDAAQANEKYVLDRLTLDGAPVDLSKVVDGAFTFTASKKTHSVIATYKVVPIANINISVSAEKFGKAQTLTSVRLYNANYDQTHTLDNGSLKVSGLAEGTYAVVADGYIPVNITVAASGSTAAVKLVYSPFKSSDDWDVSTIDGKINIGTGATNPHLFFTDDVSGDFAVTYNIKKIQTTGERRLCFTVRYGANKMLAFTNVWNNDYGMSIPAGDWNIVWNGASHTYNDWITLDFNGDEKTAYNGANGLNVTFVRQGTTLYVFFGDRFVNSYTLFGATEKVDCALTGWELFDNDNVRFDIPVAVETDASEISVLTASAVTASATNGTATLGGASSKTYKKGETVSVTLKANDHTNANKKYVLGSLSIDGTPIDVSTVQNGVYTFTATKTNHTVVATFTEVALTIDLNIAVSAEKYGAMQEITNVTLSNANYNQTHVLNSGVLQVNGLENASYTISADGYIPVTVTSATTSVKLIYGMFEQKDGWSVSSDGREVKLTTNGYGFINVKDAFTNSFAVSFTVKHPAMDSDKWSEGAALVLKVGGKVCGFQLVGSVIKTMGDFEGSQHITNAASWDQYTLSEAQQNKYRDGSIKFTVVREGKNIHLFLDDTLCKTMDFSDFDGNAEVGLTIAKWDGGADMPVSVSTNNSTIQEWLDKISA